VLDGHATSTYIDGFNVTGRRCNEIRSSRGNDSDPSRTHRGLVGQVGTLANTAGIIPVGKHRGGGGQDRRFAVD